MIELKLLIMDITMKKTLSLTFLSVLASTCTILAMDSEPLSLPFTEANRDRESANLVFAPLLPPSMSDEFMDTLYKGSDPEATRLNNIFEGMQAARKSYAQHLLSLVETPAVPSVSAVPSKPKRHPSSVLANPFTESNKDRENATLIFEKLVLPSSLMLLMDGLYKGTAPSAEFLNEAVEKLKPANMIEVFDVIKAILGDPRLKPTADE